MLRLWLIYLGMKVHAWCIDLIDIENNNILKKSYQFGTTNYEILIIDAQMVY